MWGILKYLELYESNKNGEKKQYTKQILLVDHGSFTPLAISGAGGVSKGCKKFKSWSLTKVINKKKKREL